MELEEAIKVLQAQLDTKTEKGYYKPMAEEKTRVVLNHLTKQEKMIERAKDRIEYYLMGNSTLNDFNVREKELEKLLKILNKAEESE